MARSSACAKLLLCLLSLVAGTGCAGYQTADTLERTKLGPNHCAKACYDLGMRMTALVLIESSATGCVCEPLQNAAPPAPGLAAPTGAPPPPAPTGAPPPPGAPQPPPPAQAPPHASRGAIGVAAGYI